jgi:ABC-type transport system substrate-binding protein
VKRRDTLKALPAATAALALPGLAAAAAGTAHAAANEAKAGPKNGPDGAAPAGQRVLRYAVISSETSLDPAQINDNTSRTMTSHMFESLYCFDHLARPPRVVPLTADGPPRVEDNYRRWTFKVRPGIYFADDPAFKGKKRELVADDYVFSFKRFADPALKSPVWAGVEDWKALGLSELRKEALANKTPFDIDRPIEGIKALDRYTLQLQLAEPRPRMIDIVSVPDLFGAVAREVVLAYGSKIGEHPVGTGPFKLAQWRRSSFIAFERNPNYRERLWDCQPAPDDAEGQAIAAKLRGRRLPLIDRVEISIIEESQPRWLAFLNGEHDFLDRLPNEFSTIALPGRRVAPHLAKKGVRASIALNSEITLHYFNMEDPVVGGMAPHQVALRRAIALGMDTEREIRLLRRGMAIPAQGPYMPHTSGYEAAFKSEMSQYSPARAKALLDMHGYTDRDGDGWRERPDGSPLTLEVASQPEQNDRQLKELQKRDMDAIGIRIVFKIQKWPENLKASRAGKLQMWSLAYLASGGDGQSALQRYYGPQAGNQNLARFKHPPFDALFDRITVMPDSPERLALLAEARKITIAFMPYKLGVHRLVTDMMHPQVVGYRRPAYWNGWWHFVDVAPGGASA